MSEVTQTVPELVNWVKNNEFACERYVRPNQGNPGISRQ
jgi:chromosome condensin MukBEF complex kleisin-like MukF subunit